MPSQLTVEQNNEARLFLARRLGEKLTSSTSGSITVRRAHETINLSDMSDNEFLDYLHCRETVGRTIDDLSLIHI